MLASDGVGSSARMEIWRMFESSSAYMSVDMMFAELYRMEKL